MQIVIGGCFSHDGQGTCKAKPTSGGQLNFLGRFFCAVREFVEYIYILKLIISPCDDAYYQVVYPLVHRQWHESSPELKVWGLGFRCRLHVK